MDLTKLEARPRKIFGKKCRYLRRSGITPANLYGAGFESVAVQVDSKELSLLLSTTSRNTPVQLSILGESEPRPAFIWGTQRDPLSGNVLHVDLYHVDVSRRMRAQVPLALENVSPDLEKFDRRLTQLQASIEVETLPLDLPASISVDCSSLTELDDEIKVIQLQISGKVDLLTEPDAVVARVTAIRVIAESEPGLGAEGEIEEGVEEAGQESSTGESAASPDTAEGGSSGEAG